MKQIIKKSFMYILAVATLLTAGCTADQSAEASGEGQSVKFTGGTGRSSRLVYGTPGASTGETTVPVYWQVDDQVWIYSPQSTTTHAAYAVTDTKDKDDRYSAFKPTNVAKEVHWGVDIGEKQDFHSIYPLSLVTFSKDTVFGRMPEFQNENTPLTLLYAKATDVEYTGNNQTVNLTFQDLLNKIQLTIPNPDNLNVQAVRVISTDPAKPVAGNIQGILTKSFDPTTGMTLNNYSHFVYRSLGEGDVSSEVATSISLLPQAYAANTLKLQIIVVDPLDHSKLRMQEQTIPSAIAARTIQYVKAKGILKSEFTDNPDPNTPTDWNYYHNNLAWMETISDNALISDLSIPGAADAGTNTASKSGGRKVQELSMGEMLERGVRAVELRISMNNGVLRIYSGDALDYETNTNAQEQIRVIANFLNLFHSETVVLLCRFDYAGYHNSETTRNSERTAYLQNMRTFLHTELKDKYINYKQNLTLGDCRGKILLLTTDPIDPTYEMGWDYSQTNGSAGGSLSAFGKSGGAKDLFMLGSGKGSRAEPLWVQYDRRNSGDQDRTNKIAAVKQFLDDAAGKDRNTWVFNYTGTTTSSGSSNNYATFANANYADFTSYILGNKPTGPTGIVMMDYAGADTGDFSTNPNNAAYEVHGLKLLNAVIDNNSKAIPREKQP